MAQGGARSFLSSGAGDTGIRDAPVQSLSPQPSQADTVPCRPVRAVTVSLTPCAWVSPLGALFWPAWEDFLPTLLG